MSQRVPGTYASPKTRIKTIRRLWLYCDVAKKGAGHLPTAVG